MNRESKLIEIYNFLKKYYPIILLVVFISLTCLNVFVYYQYFYLPTRDQASSNIEGAIIDREVLDKILTDVREREETLYRVRETEYPDPFN
jgi:hypothetical protein